MSLGSLYVNAVGRSEAAFLSQTIPGLFGGDALGEYFTGAAFQLEECTGTLCLPIVRGRARGLVPIVVLPPP